MNGGLLHAMGEGGLLLVLLVAGHVLGDFVFQTGAMVRRKREHLAWVWVHTAVLAAVQLVVLLPLLSEAGIAIVIGVALTHGLIDTLKIVLDRRRHRPLGYFVLDQALHLAVLAGAWRLWLAAVWSGAPPAAPFLYLPPAWVPPLTTAGAVVAAYAFNVNGAAGLVEALLRRFHLAREAAGDATRRESARYRAMGRTIGILERVLVLTLVLAGQWGALGLVMAAKSIARFRDLERRSFAEYYLIGTLASVLIATLSGIGVKLLL